MDLSSLATLGKIAGVAGIAIGAVVVLGRRVIDRIAGVPKAEQAPLLRFVATGAFGIGALGIVAWLASGLAAGNLTVTSGPGGVAAGRDVTGNMITVGQPPISGAGPGAKSP
jgi:hypothetical protein